jgi:hypothetical protein
LGATRDGEREANRVERRSFLAQQLGRKLGKVPVKLEKVVMGLSSELMDELGLALFDFEGVEDLKVWLREKGVGE